MTREVLPKGPLNIVPLSWKQNNHVQYAYEKNFAARIWRFRNLPGYDFPRKGNSGSWRSGLFGQKGYVCHHKDGETKLPIIFYGETAPRKCPLRKSKK